MSIVSRLAASQTVAIAKLTFMLAVEGDARRKTLEALRAFVTQLNAAESRLDAREGTIEDLRRRLVVADRDLSEARDEHKAFVDSSIKAYAKSLGELAASAATAADAAEGKTQSLLTLVATCRAIVGCAEGDLLDTLRALEAIRRDASGRAATHELQNTQIRDALDRHGARAHVEIVSLARFVADDLNVERNEAIRLRALVSQQKDRIDNLGDRLASVATT